MNVTPAISVLHRQQLDEVYCLPACVQMILDFYGLTRSQSEIARTLDLRPGFGVPASNIVRLRTSVITPHYIVDGTLDHLKAWLQQGSPVIAFVQAGELHQWHGRRAQHAVLLVGADAQEIHIHDPALTYGPIEVTIDEFLIAWQEMDNRYAVLVKQGAK